MGISIYDPATARYLYDYQGDKYFVPASNTKLFTLYAGLKCLGDSLVGIRYRETDTALFIVPAGDPTLLYPVFKQQPVIDFLQRTKKKIYLLDEYWKDNAWGKGWAWDDYNYPYMAERNALPVYGNTILWVQQAPPKENADAAFEPSPSIYSVPEVDWPVRFTTDTLRKTFFVLRERDENSFLITEGKEKYKEQDVPFITHGLASAILLLKDTVGQTLLLTHRLPPPARSPVSSPAPPRHPASSLVAPASSLSWPDLLTLHSRPVDSLFRPMMWHSDNFFAEQTLLMVSNERLGTMDDEQIIDTLLNADLKGLPQRPVWADGSGLSRNDLFTTRDFVWVLDKMSREFGLPRMKRILPTGGEGTLKNYYKQDSANIFAKTGSLSGVVALSGYLITAKGRLLIFSVLVNNHTGSATAVRRQVEQLIHTIRLKY